MLNRYIHEILTTAITAIEADLTILDDIFQGNYDLASEESESVKTYFAENGFSVSNAYPRKNSEYPGVFIVMAEESEVEHVMGDTGGLITDEDDPNYGKELKTSFWDYVYRLMIITEHPDITAYYYEIVKYIMTDGQSTLVNDGCFEMQMSGNELAPDPRYLPEKLFARQLIFKCRREFQFIERDSDLVTGITVAGIHLDGNDTPSDVGNVRTGITLYNESE